MKLRRTKKTVPFLGHPVHFPHAHAGLLSRILGLFNALNDLRLQKFRCKYDKRKFYFTDRAVDHWNSLPNWVVAANSLILLRLK